MNGLDFLNSNTVRNYPLKDNMDRVSNDLSFVLPNDLIADMSLSCPLNTERLFISRVVNKTNSVLVEVSGSTLGRVLGTFTVPADTEPYTTVFLAATYPNMAGQITVGYLNGVKEQPTGEFTFSLAHTELLMRVAASTYAGVNSVKFIGTTELVVTGQVVIQAENNVRFRLNDTGEVVIDAGEGLGLNAACGDGALPIKTINGVSPDADGHFSLIFSDCSAATPIEYGLLIQDTCGKPCLGCSELGELTNRTASLESDLLKLRDYIDNLAGLNTQLTTLLNFKCEC